MVETSTLAVGEGITQPKGRARYTTHNYCAMHGFIPKDQCIDHETAGIICPICFATRVTKKDKQPRRVRMKTRRFAGGHSIYKVFGKGGNNGKHGEDRL